MLLVFYRDLLLENQNYLSKGFDLNNRNTCRRLCNKFQMNTEMLDCDQYSNKMLFSVSNLTDYLDFIKCSRLISSIIL